MATIQAGGLRKSFGRIEAVKDVSFSVDKGELFGFLGPNGAGKTTTIGMLTTLLRPTGGRATVAGNDVVRDPAAVRRSIGLVLQESTYDQDLTAMHMLRIQGIAFGLSAREIRTRSEELLSLLDLWDRRNDRLREYSGGMARRAELARGLVHKPEVLFLDEPTLGLDPQSRRTMWDYIDGLRRTDGVTIFLTTHYMEEADNCGRLGIINDGRIVALDTPDRLKSQLGGDVVTIVSPQPTQVAAEVMERFGVATQTVEGIVTANVQDAAGFLPELLRGLTTPVDSVSVNRPTLEDVFVSLTDRNFGKAQNDLDGKRS